MCYTTTVIYDLCGHSKSEPRQDARCAVGIIYPSTMFHWREPEGIVHRDAMCGLCQTRLRRYSCLAPNQLEQLRQALGSA